MNRHRIFVAIPVSETLQRMVAEWVATPRFRVLPVRWLQGKNLHVTLVPPWHEVDVESPARALEKLKGTVPPFEILFTRVTYGPDPRRPRLIWAEGDTPPSLLVLKERAETVFRYAGERRPFRLHLTLARFRGENFSQFSIKRLDENVGWGGTVHSVVLMESRLKPGGADYEVLHSVNFE
jgi:2'-5' RNA ligase